MSIGKLVNVSAFVIGLSVASGAVASQAAQVYNKVELLNDKGALAVKTMVHGCKSQLQNEYGVDVRLLSYGRDGRATYALTVVNRGSFPCPRIAGAYGVGEVTLPVYTHIADGSRLVFNNPVFKTQEGVVDSPKKEPVSSPKLTAYNLWLEKVWDLSPRVETRDNVSTDWGYEGPSSRLNAFEEFYVVLASNSTFDIYNYWVENVWNPTGPHSELRDIATTNWGYFGSSTRLNAFEKFHGEFGRLNKTKTSGGIHFPS